MRRDRFSWTGSSDDGEATERTGLMRHGSYLGQYPYFGSSSDRFTGPHEGSSIGAMLREENMTEYYRQTFTMKGVGIGVRDVTQVRRHRLQRCFPQSLAPKVECESVTAYLSAGQLHSIVDADGTAAKAIIKAIAGETPCDSGEVVIDGGFSIGREFRHIVGVVSRTSVAAVPNLSVSRNLRFVLDIRTRGNRGWKRLMIQSMAAFVGISPDVKAKDLDQAGQFGLQLAMELVVDPPVVIAVRPFDGLDFLARSHAAALLRRVTAVLKKTTIITSTSLGPHLFDISDTVLLFGGAGRVLYSGPKSELVRYFNGLHIPRYHHVGTKDGGICDISGENADANDTGAATGSYRSNRQNQQPYQQSSAVNGSGASADNPAFSLLRRDENADRRMRKAVDHHGERSGGGGENDSSHPFESPSRISSRLFTDERGTPSADVVTLSRRLASPRRTVRVYSGEDAVDLAVEWADSEAQTMYYAAKFYDSQMHQRLVEAIDALATGRDEEQVGVVIPHTVEPQRALWKPVVLLSYLAHQAFSEMEFAMITGGLALALFVVSLLMHFQPQDQGGMYNIRGIYFLLFSIVLITNEASVGSVISQLKLFFHQRNSGLYGPLCFVFCLLIQTIMLRAVYLVFLVPFHLVTEQASKGVVALVGIVSVTHALLLYAIYALVPSRRFASWAAHAYFGFSLICSGFLLNLRTMPSFFGSVSVMRWGYGPALKECLQSKEFSCDGADNTSYCYTGEEYLAIEGFTNDSFGFSALALCIMGAACLLILSFTLSVR